MLLHRRGLYFVSCYDLSRTCGKISPSPSPSLPLSSRITSAHLLRFWVSGIYCVSNRRKTAGVHTDIVDDFAEKRLNVPCIRSGSKCLCLSKSDVENAFWLDNRWSSRWVFGYVKWSRFLPPTASLGPFYGLDGLIETVVTVQRPVSMRVVVDRTRVETLLRQKPSASKTVPTQ